VQAGYGFKNRTLKLGQRKRKALHLFFGNNVFGDLKAMENFVELF